MSLLINLVLIMRRLILSLFILCSYQAFSQQNYYLDSVSKNISELSKLQQIKAIVNIPYDIAVADVKTFQELSDMAISLSRELKDSLLLAQSYEKKILALHFTSKNEEALKLSLQTIRIYEALNDTLRLGNMYSELAWKLKNRDFEKAFDYMQKGISLRKRFINNNNLYSSYDNFGVLHGMKKQWDSALFYHKKALKFRKQIKDSVGIAFGYSHIANVYLNTQKYKLAESYLDSSLFIRKKRSDIYGITDSQLYLGDLYFAKKDYKKAVSSFEKAYKLSSKYGYFPLKKYASQYLYKSNKLLGKHKEALGYHIEYNELKDSIINVETNSRIAQLEIEYQTEKKEKEILTQRADIAEQELDLSKKNNYILGLGALVIVLGLLWYLFYNQQKLKNRQLKKENELKDALLKIETQNKLQVQRLRISRDLHDNIGSQLTFIISSLDNLKYGFKLPKNLSGKLKNISEFTTTTIYELRDTIWAMNKNEITFEDLQIRISNFIDKANLAAQNVKFQFKVDEAIDSRLSFRSIKGMNIYRVIQEAINNALKYAEASVIDVTIAQVDNQMEITIKDDGKGFDAANIELGNGMQNMKKRALEINGKLSVNSKKNKGTIIMLKL